MPINHRGSIPGIRRKSHPRKPNLPRDPKRTRTKPLFPKLQFARLIFKAYLQMNFEKLKSRKLWAAVIGGAVITLADAVGIDPGVAQNLVGIIAAYVVGQGIADHGAKGGSQK